jgi:hypothetical protein
MNLLEDNTQIVLKDSCVNSRKLHHLMDPTKFVSFIPTLEIILMVSGMEEMAALDTGSIVMDQQQMLATGSLRMLRCADTGTSTKVLRSKELGLTKMVFLELGPMTESIQASRLTTQYPPSRPLENFAMHKMNAKKVYCAKTI